MPVGYLDDVMLFHHFAEAWDRFMDSDDKEKIAKTHPLFEVCREIWYEQNIALVRARKAKQKA